MRQRDNLIESTAAVVRVSRVANGLFLAAIVTGLASTWVFPSFYEGLLAEAGPLADVPAALIGIRLLMVIGIAMAIATDRLLVPLGLIVLSAREGDPFAPANAHRLQRIGWALLSLQLLDLPCGYLARFWPSLGSAAPSGDISVGGWLATLMVFVLARVFASGSAMRDDLAGTV